MGTAPPPVAGVAEAAAAAPEPAAAADDESFFGAAGVAAGPEDWAGVEAADAVLKATNIFTFWLMRWRAQKNCRKLSFEVLEDEFFIFLDKIC